MTIKYSCFISYPHGRGKAYEDFVREFVAALNDEMGVLTRKEVWIDYERLQGGYRYNQLIAADLCKAACMIVIYTPLYFDSEHNYCAREYKAMELLEEQRRAQLANRFTASRGLIIPVVLRGMDDLPKAIKDDRQAYDFEDLLLSDVRIKIREMYAKEIRGMAQYVVACVSQLERLSEELRVDLCGDCDEHCLPSEVEAKSFVEALLGRPVPQVTVPFVNRAAV